MLRLCQVSAAMLVVSALALSVGANAQAPSGNLSPSAAPASGVVPTKAGVPRYLVYFDEFSAYLSPRAKAMIAHAAKEAKETGAKSITVQARASATGAVQTNKYLALTRASVVADQLEADGIEPAIIQQQPIGQTGSSDPSVFNRRVDIILNR